MKNIKKYDLFNLKNKFNKLKEQWIKEAAIFSNPKYLYGNRHYQEIIKLGIDVVPILLEDLKSPDGDWFNALSKITNENPVSPVNIGKTIEMEKDWMEWAKNKSFNATR